MLPPTLEADLLELLPDAASLRLARPGQLHLTLQFLGPVCEDVSNSLQRRLAAVACSRFRMLITGTGVFEQAAGSRGVLWAGVQLSEPLQRLYSTVTAMVQAEELLLEDRPWSPHFTLARYSGGPPEALPQFLQRGQRLHVEADVTDFQLLESRPGPAGCVYESRAVFPLS